MRPRALEPRAVLLRKRGKATYRILGLSEALAEVVGCALMMVMLSVASGGDDLVGKTCGAEQTNNG